MARNTTDTAPFYVDASALAKGQFVLVDIDSSALAEGRIVAAAHYGEKRPLVIALNGRPDDKESWDDAVEFAEFFLAEHAS